MLRSMSRPQDHHDPLQPLVAFDGSAEEVGDRPKEATQEIARPAAGAERAVPNGGLRIQVFPLEEV
jgi:hypothetical protein